MCRPSLHHRCQGQRLSTLVWNSPRDPHLCGGPPQSASATTHPAGGEGTRGWLCFCLPSGGGCAIYSSTNMATQQRKRIAVVGSGVAGLSAAFLLSREHEVHVFEREATIGMDAHSFDVHGARMDIPLRVFSESYYPNLCNLYQLLGVKYAAADYSFSCVGGCGSTRSAYFRYINFFWRGMALPFLACLNPWNVGKCMWLAYQVRARATRTGVPSVEVPAVAPPASCPRHAELDVLWRGPHLPPKAEAPPPPQS
jgi:hypothetical protein